MAPTLDSRPPSPSTDSGYLSRFGPGLRYLLIALALLFLFPFYLMIRTAVITQPEVASFDWGWWPQETQWPTWTGPLQRRADERRAAQLGHSGAQPRLPDAVRLDGGLRAGAATGAGSATSSSS